MIQKRATLDEKSVQAVAQGAVDIPRRRRASGTSRSSRVQKGHLLDGLMAPAEEVVTGMGIDLRRVQVVSPTEAIVWNHPAPWPHSSESEQSTDERQHHE